MLVTQEYDFDLGSAFQRDGIFVTSNRHVPVKNTFSSSVVVSLGRFNSVSFSDVFFVVKAMNKFNCKLVIN
jgi:hypothetical protein